jgi:putative pyruvate formate lyase activating enzyme
MSQYIPMHRASRIPLLSRTISVDEYKTVLQLLTDLGLENGWIQEMGAAENYLPDFEREGHPFSPVPQRTKEFIPAKVSRDH